MKRLTYLILGTLFTATAVSAQPRTYADTEKLYSTAPSRTEIITPKVNGYNCYTADLHVHTMFSDGDVTPAERVKEAWIDGLDIMAITDHIETRRQEREMLKFLKGYSPEKKGFEPINVRCSRGVHADERGIVSDLNLSTELARAAVKNYPGLTIIKGTEISREPVHIGHYCALFTTDNNALYSTDDAQTIRNARAQGAIITHNHPGWERTSTDYTEFEKGIYAEGLIDGIEISNGSSFYPEIVRRAIDKKLYMVSATDIHATTASIYGKANFYRNMTLIFAKNTSEEEIRKALLSQRTLGYSAGYIIGEKSLLTDFFRASVTAKRVADSSKGVIVEVANHTSFPYTLRYGTRILQLDAMSKISLTVKSAELSFIVENMIHVDYQHPTITLTIN